MVHNNLADLHMQFKAQGVEILNAFSLNMLQEDNTIDFHRISRDIVRYLLVDVEVHSHIGHQDTAALVSTDLGVEIPMVRDTYTFEGCAIVAQYTGPRLAEGTTVLPEGAAITYWLVQA